MRLNTLAGATPKAGTVTPVAFGSTKTGAAASLAGSSLTITRASWTTPPNAGDTLVAFLASDDANVNAAGAAMGDPTGWTRIATGNDGVNGYFAVFKRTATGNSSDDFSSLAPNNGGSYAISAMLYRATGGTGTVTVSSITQASNEVSIVAPSLGSAGNLLLTGWGAAAAISRTVTYPGTMTGQKISGGANCNLAAAYELLGTPGTRTSTWSGTSFGNTTFGVAVTVS